MPVDTVALSPQEQSFSPYPVNMDSFFERNTVVIKVLPDGYIPSLELSCCNFQVTSAAQYKEFLDQELSFWTLNDSKKLLAEYTKVSSIDAAIKHFNNALTSYKSTPHSSSSGDSHMKNSVGAISAGTISSKIHIGLTSSRIRLSLQSLPRQLFIFCIYLSNLAPAQSTFLAMQRSVIN